MAHSSLADEIRKRGPFQSLQQEAYLNIARTNALLHEAFDRLFAQHGLCQTHYNILRILAGELAAGTDGVPALEVRDRLVTRVPDITRLVDKLEKQGLVQRRRGQDDRRNVLLSITPKGQHLLQELHEPVLQQHRQQLGHLTPDELTQLCRLLEKARNAPQP